MRQALLVLLSLALCAAQTSGNESDEYIPAPYFNEGENLSSENCGNETTRDEWVVYVKNKRTHKYCLPYIAISQETVLGIGYCPYIDERTDLQVFPKKCYQRETEENCTKVSVKVLSVIDISINPKADLIFKILMTEKMPSEFVTPICLFNRDNVMDLQLQRESPYFEWTWTDFLSNPRNVTGQSNCSQDIRSSVLRDLEYDKIPIQNILCVENAQYGPLLINFYKGRYFLRGVRFIPRRIYHDILPYIDEIAWHAKDISVLHPIPQTKPPRGFTGQDNLSFPNCGRKPTSTRRKRGIDYFVKRRYPVPPPSGRLAVLAGDKAQIFHHPWNAYIENYEIGNICGGTLISPTVVLTAAHCLYESEAEDFIVYFGLYDKRQRGAPDVQRRLVFTFHVSNLIVHPKYDPARLISDVGIMILNKKIEITNQVRPICLWNDDSNLARLAGTKAMAVGFGLADNYTFPDELQEARLPIRGHKECFFSEKRIFGKYLRPGDNFCAGYTNGITVCNGDSGGSLSVEKNGRWFIRGIVSFGKSKKVVFEGEKRWFCHPNHYTLFADVANYMDWIVENTPEISFRN